MDSTDSNSDRVARLVWHLSDIAHVEADILELCQDDFGIPKNCSSDPARDSNGVPISNSSFLPPPGARLEDYHWDITGESRPPPLPDCRELWLHTMGPGVYELSSAQTPLDLSIAVGHAMLGWLSMIHKGYLHRDIGVPGVFRLSDPTEMRPFIPGNFEGLLGETDDQVLRDQVERLQNAIENLGITGICHGVTQPSDMSVEMKGYYASGGVGAHQPDYYEFMSSGLLRSIRVSEQYLHSPVDDLESYYYTMQWAAVHNNGPDFGMHDTDEINALREDLSDSADKRFQATLFIQRIRPNNEGDVLRFGAFLAKLQPVFKEWYPSILALIQSWRTVKDGVDSSDQVSRYYVRHALVFAYRGVSDYLKIVHKHRDSLR